MTTPPDPAQLQIQIDELYEKLAEIQGRIEMGKQTDPTLYEKIPNLKEASAYIENSYKEAESALIALLKEQRQVQPTLSDDVATVQEVQLGFDLGLEPVDEDSQLREQIRAGLASRKVRQARLLQSKLEAVHHLLGDSEAFRLIMKASQASDTTSERDGYIIELRKLSDQRVIDALLELLGIEGNLGYWAALAVARLGDKSAVLLRLLEKLKHPQPEVRAQTISALSHQAEVPLNPQTEQAYQVNASIVSFGPKDDQIVEALMEMLDDPAPTVRSRAVSALCHLGDQRATEKLVKALEDPAQSVRISAAAFLGGLGDERAIAPLLRAVKSGDKEVESRASQSLGMLGYEGEGIENPWKRLAEAMGEISAGLAVAFGATDELEKTQTEEVNMGAYLSRFRQKMAPEGIESLIAKLKDPISSARADAATRLGFSGDNSAVEPLLAALDDPDFMVKAAVVSALGFLKDKRVVEPLTRLLKDKNVDIRGKAAFALHRLGDPDSFDALVAALSDESYEVRMWSVMSLGNLGDKRVFEAVLARLKDENEIVQQMALSALGKVGDERAFQPLLEATKSENPTIRMAAVEGLGVLGDARALLDLEWLEENDPYEDEEGYDETVRHAARHAIEAIRQKAAQNG